MLKNTHFPCEQLKIPLLLHPERLELELYNEFSHLFLCFFFSPSTVKVRYKTVYNYDVGYTSNCALGMRKKKLVESEWSVVREGNNNFLNSSFSFFFHFMSIPIHTRVHSISYKYAMRRRDV